MASPRLIEMIPYESLKREIDKRHTYESDRRNKENLKIILDVFSEEET